MYLVVSCFVCLLICEFRVFWLLRVVALRLVWLGGGGWRLAALIFDCGSLLFGLVYMVLIVLLSLCF